MIYKPVGADKSKFTISDGENTVDVYAKPGISLREYVDMDTLSVAQGVEFFAMHIVDKFVVNGTVYEGEDKYNIDTRIITESMREYGSLGEALAPLSKV